MARKLTAVMAADVAGFSRLVRADEDGTLARLREILDGTVRPAVADSGGRIVKTVGDGFLAEFDSAVDAVAAALLFQERIANAEAARPADARIRFRVGVNIGDVVTADGDIFGDGVNLADRLQALADPDGIAVSSLVHEAVRHRAELGFEDRGAHAVKGLDGRLRVFTVTRAGSAARRPAAGPVGGDFLTEEAPTPAGKPSIAILPFRNLTGSPDHEFVADGMRLGIQASLVQLSGLFLVNAAVTNRYKTAPASAEEAAADLDVRYVLEGALQAAGGRIRIRLQLVDAREHRVVWAERYDRPADDVFAIEDEIVGEVVHALGVSLIMSPGTRIVAGNIRTRAGRDAFYRAMSNLYTGTREANAVARRNFAYLHEEEGETFAAPGNLAVTHWLDRFNGWSDDPDASAAEAERWAMLAASMPNNGLGPTVLANIRLMERRHDEALALGQEGVRSRTSCPMSHCGLANILTLCGEAGPAISHARHGLALERAFPSWMVNLLAAAYRDNGEYARAARAAETSIRLNPQDVDARAIAASIAAMAGEADAARGHAEAVIALEPAFSVARYGERQPYRDPARLAAVTGALEAAGLPR